jgi:hypothetical protein
MARDPACRWPPPAPAGAARLDASPPQNGAIPQQGAGAVLDREPDIDRREAPRLTSGGAAHRPGVEDEGNGAPVERDLRVLRRRAPGDGIRWSGTYSRTAPSSTCAVVITVLGRPALRYTRVAAGVVRHTCVPAPSLTVVSSRRRRARLPWG